MCVAADTFIYVVEVHRASPSVIVARSYWIVASLVLDVESLLLVAWVSEIVYPIKTRLLT